MKKIKDSTYKCSDEQLKKLNSDLGKERLPHFFYKYMTIKGIKRFLENGKLLYANPFMFNDPFECKAKLLTEQTSLEQWVSFLTNGHYTKRKINLYAKELINTPSKADEMVAKGINKVYKTLGILCLSPDCDNLLMWAHYTQNHTGVCIKFDISKDKESFCYPQKVHYDKLYPQYNFITEPKKLVEIIFHKSDEWKYEEEYRVVRADGFGLQTIKKEAVVEIIFGCKTSKKEIETIRKFATDLGYTAKFKQMRLSDTNYILTMTEL